MCRVFQERLHHPWGLGLPEKNYHFRFTNDFSAIFILFYSFDSQMCDTVEDGEERKPAREQFGLYNGSPNNVRLKQFSLPRQSYLVILDTISHLFCNEADYLRKRKQLKLPCLLVGHHFRYHQALLDHPNKKFPVTVIFPIGPKSK